MQNSSIVVAPKQGSRTRTARRKSKRQGKGHTSKRHGKGPVCKKHSKAKEEKYT